MSARLVFVLSFFAIGMGLFFAISAFSLGPGNAAVPVSLVFTNVGGLGCAIAATLTRQQSRLDALERQLAEKMREFPRAT